MIESSFEEDSPLPFILFIGYFSNVIPFPVSRPLAPYPNPLPWKGVLNVSLIYILPHIELWLTAVFWLSYIRSKSYLCPGLGMQLGW